MKYTRTTNNILVFLCFFSTSLVQAQTIFDKYFCERDTQFSNKETLSSSLFKNTIIHSKSSVFNISNSTQRLNGFALNRSGNFKNFTGNSNLRTFANAQIVITHRIDSAGKIMSKLSKSDVVFNINENATTATQSFIDFHPTLSPKPIELGNVYLGFTNFQTSNNRGNFFAIEKYFQNNNELDKTNNDTFNSRDLLNSASYTYPSDNTNYKDIINQLNSAEYTGWIVEMDRLDNKFQSRRFDMGRSPRNCALFYSIRNSTSGTNSNLNQSYQILGEENSLNILVKTQIANSVQEFYLYSEEENSLGSHWTLLNKTNSGKIQPLSRNVLVNLYDSIVTNPNLEFSYFFNVTDIKVNDVNNSIVMVSPGGKMDLNAFNTKYKTSIEKVFMTYLSSAINGTVLEDKLGHILEIDIQDQATFTKCGIASTKGRFFSNPYSISFVNLNYIDTFSQPVNTSYALISERTFDNTQGQNPAHKKSVDQFQNETYLFDLKSLLQEDARVNFANKPFHLYLTSQPNVANKLVYYPETYLPSFFISQNNNTLTDSLSMIRGFADYYINPEVCDSTVSTPKFNKNRVSAFVYPNPAVNSDNIVKISLTDDIQLYTMNGALVRSLSNVNEINVSNLNSGIYFIKGSKGWSEKLIIQ